MKKSGYQRFFLMLLLSFVLMYFIMFLNVFSFSHVYLSMTRFYMALLMVSAMSIIMLSLMIKMYPNKKLNAIIIVASIIIFILVLTLLRTQVPIGDVQYMKAMIPHHSSAILTSKNSNLEDPEVQELARNIIETQEEEIAKMKNILERLK